MKYVLPVVALVLLAWDLAAIYAPPRYGPPVSFSAQGVVTEVGPEAARSGVRVGDVLDTSHMTLAQRYTGVELFKGGPIRLPIRDTSGTLRFVTLHATVTVPSRPGLWVEAFASTFGLLLVAYLSYRRPRLMMLFLMLFLAGGNADGNGTINLAALIPNDVLRGLAIGVQYVLEDVFPPFLLAAFVVRFPGERPSPEKRSAIRKIDAVVILALVVEMVHVGLFPLSNHVTYRVIYSMFAALAVLIAAILSMRYVDERERARVGIVFGGTMLGGVAYAVCIAAWNYFGYNMGIYWYLLWCMFIVPVSVAYAILRHKLFDIAFVLNRTLVYAITSAVVVVIFAALEFLAERYLTTLTHVEGVALEFLLALAVILSVRPVHRRVDTAVDSVFFRTRHEQEAALRRFAVNAQFYTAPGPLVRDTLDALERYGRVRGAAVYLSHSETMECAGSTFESPAASIDENDPLYVAMRAHQHDVEADETSTKFPGSIVFPMLLGGRLAGAITVGERETGEELPPDIHDAIVRVTESITISLAAMETERLKQDIGLLRQRLSTLGA